MYMYICMYISYVYVCIDACMFVVSYMYIYISVYVYAVVICEVLTVRSV